ncbi:MAG: acyl-CoA dehydrogenase family protein [Pseudomonadales bacterium]
MDLQFGEVDLGFQREVQEFRQKQLPEHIRKATADTTTLFLEKDVALEWQRILVDKGWAVPNWPSEWGGTRWTPTQRYIFTMECYKAGAPMLIPLGLSMLAPVILAFGSEQQKQKYLPRMLSGEHYWCQGYSEPGSGSDLASLKLKAERRDNHYVVNGSKLWTTHAQFADHIFCLVRTDSTGKPQQGISFLLIEMDAPGVTVDPIITIGLDHEVNQVFFDDVKVPSANLVGEEGQGWRYAKYLLEFERGGGMSSALRQRDLEHLKEMAADIKQQDPSFDSDLRYSMDIARIEIDIHALEISELRVLTALAAGEQPGAESSAIKLATVDIEQRTHQLCMDAIGYHALPFKQPHLGTGYEAVVPSYLNGRAASIFGGSREIQLNIIAKVVLGL